MRPELYSVPFYAELSPYGRWFDSPALGLVWIPNEASDPGFRPYASNGRWVLTSQGWIFQSSYPWDAIAHHYGRWVFDSSIGNWAWIPDTEWGAAWVDWRWSNDYVGWAPLPPRYTRGVLAKYAKLVQSASRGAVLS